MITGMLVRMTRTIPLGMKASGLPFGSEKAFGKSFVRW